MCKSDGSRFVLVALLLVVIALAVLGAATGWVCVSGVLASGGSGASEAISGNDWASPPGETATLSGEESGHALTRPRG
jgi:hypothetical protein